MSPGDWLKKRGQSIGFALAGLVTLLQTQPHARVHFLATWVVIAAGFATGLDRFEWLMLVAAVTWVWLAEALNTALEFLADAAVPDWHALIKKAKDVAAAGVLLASIGAVVVALLIFGPHWFH